MEKDKAPKPSVDILDQIMKDSHTFRDAIAGNGKIKTIAKGTILQTEGNTTQKAFFVKKGLLRSYTIDAKGKIHIFMFAPEGWAVADVQSYSFSKPSQLFIDALEDSEVVELNVRRVSEVQLSNDILQLEIERLLRRVSVLQERVIMLMSSSAQERYEHFIATYPQLIHRIPQKMIASYLGITPEALSTIRAKMRRK